MTHKKINILDTNINTEPLSELIDASLLSINNHENPIHFACANPHSVVTAKTDKEFLLALSDADIVVADGTGITLAARLAFAKTLPRITGYDYFYNLLDSLNKKESGKVFFFGSTEKVLELIKDNFSALFPNIEIAGTLSPPFRAWSEKENDKMLETINASNADILWVGMTAPKQEKWVFQNRNKLNTPVIGSVGAVFDFIAGTHPKAPDWMSRYGLEWLYRLIREPKRMWRRNFVSTPKFVMYVLYDLFFNKKTTK